MIPKIIHYCWFGEKPLPELARKCIESWNIYCPDYEIIRWDEKNTDLLENDYIKEAYQEKKWAFITDYVRLKVLYENGGIYMDTDVEVCKSLDKFLQHKAFSGFEAETRIPTGIMASEKGHYFIKKLLDYYENRHFLRPNGTCDTTTNVQIITDIAKEYGIRLDNTLQEVCDMTFYPNDYFCPKDYLTGELNITKRTACIHHFDGSWLTNDEHRDMELMRRMIAKYNKKNVLFHYRVEKYIKHPSNIMKKIIYVCKNR